MFIFLCKLTLQLQTRMALPMLMSVHGIKMVYIHSVIQLTAIFEEFPIIFTFLFPFLSSNTFETSVQQLQLHPHALNSCNKQVNTLLLLSKPILYYQRSSMIKGFL